MGDLGFRGVRGLVWDFVRIPTDQPEHPEHFNSIDKNINKYR